MNFQRLEKNIIDMIKEQQLKLGYRNEVVRLYYPALSINRLLETDYTVDGLNGALKEFVLQAKDRLGEIEYTCQNGRYCFKLPEKAGAYVHGILKDNEFISEFIKTIGKHGCTMDEIISVFRKYSRDIHIERPEGKDFDYVVYFEDSSIDEYKYCLTREGNHLIYHRFLPEDYRDL